MTDDQLLRYSRHILLDEIGIEGQERILASRVLMVGAGGLGSAAALYLACAGVGHFTVVDHDSVDLTNLQRQIAHTTQRVGQPKASSVQAAIAGLNPEVVVTPVARRADAMPLPHARTQWRGETHLPVSLTIPKRRTHQFETAFMAKAGEDFDVGVRVVID